jgi:hypothetical protein
LSCFNVVEALRLSFRVQILEAQSNPLNPKCRHLMVGNPPDDNLNRLPDSKYAFPLEMRPSGKPFV